MQQAYYWTPVSIWIFLDSCQHNQWWWELLASIVWKAHVTHLWRRERRVRQRERSAFFLSLCPLFYFLFYFFTMLPCAIMLASGITDYALATKLISQTKSYLGWGRWKVLSENVFIFLAQCLVPGAYSGTKERLLCLLFRFWSYIMVNSTCRTSWGWTTFSSNRFSKQGRDSK